MKSHMKLYAGLALALIAFGFSSAASATYFTVTANVETIAAFNGTASWYDAITLVGVTSLGDCGRVFRITKNTNGGDPSADRIFTLALTAYTLGKPLFVEVDDTTLLNGQCEIYFDRLST